LELRHKVVLMSPVCTSCNKKRLQSKLSAADTCWLEAWLAKSPNGLLLSKNTASWGCLSSHISPVRCQRMGLECSQTSKWVSRGVHVAHAASSSRIEHKKTTSRDCCRFNKLGDNNYLVKTCPTQNTLTNSPDCFHQYESHNCCHRSILSKMS
jgi:hypothetical protein